MPDHTTIPSKRCTKCGETKPATPEFFYRDKNRKDGLFPRCRTCQRNDWPQFNTTEYKTNKREYDALYRATNAERLKTIQAHYRMQHAEEIKASGVAYRAAHYETINARVNAWKHANPHKNRAISHRRRAKQRDLPATFTHAEWLRCLEYWNDSCAYCGRPQGLWHTLAQDHYIPLSRGGVYAVGNILPACHGKGGCNNRKHNTEPHEWLIRTFGKRKAAAIEKRIQRYFDEVRKAAGDES